MIDARAWAARELGLPAGAAPAEVRAALLRDVTRAGFVPPPERQQAWQALCGSRPDCPPAALLAEEARLRNDIDDFAAAFFATPVAARRRRWQELSQQCASSPPLAVRLAALEPGLDLDLCHDGTGNPRTEQLASHVAGLFVLAPAARATQRQAVLRAMQAELDGWEEAARQLRATAPALAQLEPTLLASILGWREQRQRLARLRPARAPAARPAPVVRAPAPTQSSDWGGSGKGIGCGGILAAMFVVRLCAGLGSHHWNNDVRTPPPVPRFQAPPQLPRFEDPPPVDGQFNPAKGDDAADRLRKAFEKAQREQEDRTRQRPAWPPPGNRAAPKAPVPTQRPDPRKP